MAARREDIAPGCTLYNGNCLEALADMEEDTVDITLTDPPYASGAFLTTQKRGTVDKKYLQGLSGPGERNFPGDSRDQLSFMYFSGMWCSLALAATKNMGVMMAFVDWRNLAALIEGLQVGGLTYRGIVAWNKGEQVRPNPGLFRNQCEFVVYGTKGPNDVTAKTYRPGVVETPLGEEDGGAALVRERAMLATEKAHPTQKPVGVLCQLLKLRPAEGQTVLDPFMGSGSTGEACMRSHFGFIGVEQDPHWFDVACRRLEGVAKQGRLF